MPRSRIARWERDEIVHYQAYTSRDGTNWTRGGVWTHELEDPELGLVSMGGSGFTAEFDYVKAFRLQVQGWKPLKQPAEVARRRVPPPVSRWRACRSARRRAGRG